MSNMTDYEAGQLTEYEIIKGNCLKVIDNLYEERGEFVDLIFCDPPYFLSNGGITCNFEWIKRCQKILKKNGTLMVSGTHHIIYSVGFAMQQLNMKVLNNITWQKPNPPPNLSCRYFTHSTETIIWAAKNEKSKHKFNYDLMKNVNEGKQMKDVWTMTAPLKKEKIFGKHPTQKPLALLDRLILSSTNAGDIVLDAFNGSGTTGVSCIQNGRKYIGIELEGEYIKLTKKRLEEVAVVTQLKRASI